MTTPALAFGSRSRDEEDPPPVGMRAIALAYWIVAGGFAALGLFSVVQAGPRYGSGLGMFGVIALYFVGLGFGARALRDRAGHVSPWGWSVPILSAHVTTAVVGLALFAFDALNTWPLGRSFERYAAPIFDWGLILSGVPAIAAAWPYGSRAPLIVVGLLGPVVLGIAFLFAVAGMSVAS